MGSQRAGNTPDCEGLLPLFIGGVSVSVWRCVDELNVSYPSAEQPREECQLWLWQALLCWTDNSHNL